jgi:glycosyltransferase involved in cell wall biosynthesis
MSDPEDRLTVLALSPFLPYPPDHGGRIRTFLLLRELARQGHRVRLVPLIESESERKHIPALEAEGIAVAPVLHPRRFGRLTARDRGRKLLNLARGRSDVLARFASPAALRTVRSLDSPPPLFDIVLAELLWTAPLALALPARARVLDAHNVETVISERTATETRGWFSRLMAHREARGMRREESRLIRGFDAVVVVSEADRGQMAGLAPGTRLEVVGNCVDTGDLTPLPSPPDGPPVCLFVGSTRYPPNAAAVERFARDILPRVRSAVSDARFIAVGADPPAGLQRLAAVTPGMELAGYVENVADAYHRASQVVVPIEVGGGTRTKILEALALGRPIVSTTVGAEGLPVSHEEHVLIADGPEAFARAIIRLHRDPELAARLVDRGRRMVEEQGSARAAGGHLERILLEVATRKRRE